MSTVAQIANTDSTTVRLSFVIFFISVSLRVKAVSTIFTEFLNTAFYAI
jgi:hypothetical protein